MNLLVLDADGSEQPQNVTLKLTGGFYSEYPPASDPAWSRDGQKLAFARLNTGFGIYVVSADGSGLRKLTRKSSGRFAAPAWSPDGRKVAFVFDPDEDSEFGDSEVFVVNADGTGQRNLTRNPANDSDPDLVAGWTEARLRQRPRRRSRGVRHERRRERPTKDDAPWWVAPCDRRASGETKNDYGPRKRGGDNDEVTRPAGVCGNVP